MSTLAVTPPPETRLARPLKVLVPLINEDLVKAEASGLEYYRAAGEKLQEAKSQMSRGDWGLWVAKNFSFSQATAYRWMELAGELEFRQATQNQEDTNFSRARKPQPREIRTLSDLTDKRDPGHKPQWHAPVQEILTDRLNVPRMRQEAQNREKEAQLRRQLGVQLIDIGYKVLATRLHPDKGGSQEAMARLNKVRDILKGAL